jgi:hypothetical protein
MKSAGKKIATYDDLKRQTATLGMVLSGIRLGQDVPERDRYLTIGLELCDVVAELGRLGESPVSSTFEEAAFIDRFYQRKENPLRHPERLPELEQGAKATRRVFETLLHFQEVSPTDLDQSAEFCHLVYDAF